MMNKLILIVFFIFSLWNLKNNLLVIQNTSLTKEGIFLGYYLKPSLIKGAKSHSICSFAIDNRIVMIKDYHIACSKLALNQKAFLKLDQKYIKFIWNRDFLLKYSHLVAIINPPQIK